MVGRADRARSWTSRGVLGVKVYYALIGHDPATRDKYLEASIFDFLPPHQLDVLDQYGAWVTLHVPKAERLGASGEHRRNPRDPPALAPRDRW